MEQPVILSKLEQEYLLRAIEAAAQVRDPHQLFLWAQGQMQGLLPHCLLVAMQCDAAGTVLHSEALHGTVLAPAEQRAVQLAARLAAHACAHALFPCAAEQGGAATALSALAAFQDDIDAGAYANVLLHGSGPMAGGQTVFALFGLPQRPGQRQAYFLELLLPYMHFALLRALASSPETGHTAGAFSARHGTARALSAREIEILVWLRDGKSNAQIASLVGLSALTVKNHLQRIYKVLAVGNRTQAVIRSAALRLVPDAPASPLAMHAASRCARLDTGAAAGKELLS